MNLLFNFPLNPLYRISLIKLLLPDPLTPVTHVNLPKGISTSIFLRLFCLAPLIISDSPFPDLRVCGIGIVSRLEIY